MTWFGTLRDALLELVIMPLLEKHFPAGVPAEAINAVMTDVDRILQGEPVNWFDLRRLVASVTTQALAKLEEAL